MTAINLHDSEIKGIEHDDVSQELILKATHPLGQNYQIIFLRVDWWELCSFGIQNILFSIAPFDYKSLTKTIIKDQDIADKYVNMVYENHRTLFVMKATIGLEGWILADEMRIDLV